jgi:hypothetical protein
MLAMWRKGQNHVFSYATSKNKLVRMSPNALAIVDLEIPREPFREGSYQITMGP